MEELAHVYLSKSSYGHCDRVGYSWLAQFLLGDSLITSLVVLNGLRGGRFSLYCPYGA